MAADEAAKQQHLDDHYGDLGLELVDDVPSGKGMTSREAGAFLRTLRPVVRVGQSLREAAKKVAKKG